ncbi:hypothetical protein [Actinomadura sp. NPDC000600]|uniref:hypothetical protein n=1 Tax=Actinomadura sp. NPDC000600 TaxID=3154262 RepID=UPI003391A787
MAISESRRPTARATNALERARSPIIRKAVMLGSALALASGMMAAPAQAAGAHADATATATTAASSVRKGAWHFWKSYWTEGKCVAAGKRVLASNPARYKAALCDPGYGTDGRLKWHLYIYI